MQEATLPTRPLSGLTEISVSKVLDMLEEGSASSPSEWKLAWKRFRAANWITRLKAIRAALTQRQPPWQLRGNARIFHGCAGGVPVEVHVVYDISLVDETITFVVFEYYTPERGQLLGQDTEDGPQPF